MKVETDIVSSIVTSPTGRAVIVRIMYGETLKTDVIVFIGNVIMTLTSNWLVIFSIRVRVDTDNITGWDQKENAQVIENVQCVSHTFIDTHNITRWNQRKTVHFTDNFQYQSHVIVDIDNMAWWDQSPKYRKTFHYNDSVSRSSY